MKKIAERLSSKIDSGAAFLYMSMGEMENAKMKNGFNEMARVFNGNVNKKLVWFSEFTKNADHQNNAEISASTAIRKWAEYLKMPK